jgi:hypothetical protein
MLNSFLTTAVILFLSVPTTLIVVAAATIIIVVAIAVFPPIAAPAVPVVRVVPAATVTVLVLLIAVGSAIALGSAITGRRRARALGLLCAGADFLPDGFQVQPDARGGRRGRGRRGIRSSLIAGFLLGLGHQSLRGPEQLQQ